MKRGREDGEPTYNRVFERELIGAERSLRRVLFGACGVTGVIVLIVVAHLLKWHAAEHVTIVAYSALLLWSLVLVTFTAYSLVRLGTHIEDELLRKSMLDTLTGAYNRHYLHMRMKEECERVRRYGGHVAILFIDLDNFKQVNDRHGHKEGDRVLQAVVNTMRAQMRSADALGRMGGDEFIALLPTTDRQQAQVLAGRLLEAARGFRVKVAGDNLVDFLRLSIGLAVCPDNGDSADGLITAADNALYKAKQEGGDKFHASDERIAASVEQPEP